MEQKIAICSDIHGNWEALEAVLEDMDRFGVELRICLGDVIGYGAEPARCVKALMGGDWLVLSGNHEEGLLFPQTLEYFNQAAVAGILWARKQLSQEAIKWLRKIPHVIRGDSFELVHASLFQPALWNYVSNLREAECHFEMQQKQVCFCGHTHMGMVWKKGRRIYSRIPTTRRFKLSPKQKMLINVGSVGQPRDGIPKASYVLYQPESGTVQFRRVAYDVDAARDKIIRAGLPFKLGARLETGR